MDALLPTARNFVMFGAPALLGILELGHPAFSPWDPVIDTLAPIALWWTALHVVQVPLFGLLGLAVVLLLVDLHSRAAQISRCAIAVFVVVYPAFDGAVGIASGVILHNLGTIGPAERAAIEPALWALFWGPVTGMMAIIGSAAWLIALVAAALAFRQAGATVPEYGLLASSGLLLGIAHVRPIGPLACLCFVIAAALIERRNLTRTLARESAS